MPHPAHISCLPCTTHTTTYATKRPPNRCVFTKAANEIRTSSEMLCESNRGNVLSIIVKDHLHARRQIEQKRRQKQRLGRTNSAAAAGVPTPPSSSCGKRGPKERVGARETERSREETGAGSNERGSSKTHGQEPEPLPSLPPPPLVLSTKMAKMPLSGVIVATSPLQPDREHSGDGRFVTAPAAAATATTAAAAAAVSRKRRRGAPNAPPVRQQGGVQNVSSLAGHSRVPRSSGIQVKDAPALADMGTSGAGGSAAWGVRRLGLPPLEERYPNVKDSWARCPVELRLERPRCKSVDIAHLDQPAYKEYMKRVTRQGRQGSVGAEMSTQEQRVTRCGGGDGNRVRSNLTKSKQRDKRAGQSFRVSSDCLPVQEEEAQAGDGGGGGGSGGDHGGSGEGGDDGRHRGSFLSSVSQITTPGGKQTNKTGRTRSRTGSTASAAAAAFLSNGDDHRLVDRNASLVDCRVNNGYDPWRSAQTTPTLMHALSRFQLREGENGVFRLTSCDVEGAPRLTTNDQDTPSQVAAFGSGHDDSSSSKASMADGILASEALRLRSNGARKVFKQTQRLLGALRTPAGSCQTTSTDSRRGCGGGSMGGHSSVVVHHGAGAGDTGNGGGNTQSSSNLSSFPGRNDEVWRTARGTRPARLAEVFRCVAPPHTVRIECEIILHESLSRTGGGRDGDGGAGGHNGTWDDFVFAWEVSTGAACGMPSK